MSDGVQKSRKRRELTDKREHRRHPSINTLECPDSSKQLQQAQDDATQGQYVDQGNVEVGGRNDDLLFGHLINEADWIVCVE